MNVLAELRKTRQQIEQLEQIIDIQKRLCEAEPNSFAYSLSMQSFMSRNAELNERMSHLLMERSEEILQVRFEGEKVGKGTISLNVLGAAVTGLQNIISSIAQSIHSGSKTRGPISIPILKASELYLDSIYQGSFGMKIIGNTSPVIFGESLLARSLESFFDLLNAYDKSDVLLSVAGKLGPRTLSNYNDWVKHLHSTEISINADWIDLEGNNREWYGTPKTFEYISLVLEQIKENEPSFNEIEGALLGASLIRNKFEFVSKNDEQKISGSIAVEARDSILEFFGQNCIGEFQIDTLRNTVTGESKTSWTLLKLKSNKKM